MTIGTTACLSLEVVTLYLAEDLEIEHAIRENARDAEILPAFPSLVDMVDDKVDFGAGEISDDGIPIGSHPVSDSRLRPADGFGTREMRREQVLSSNDLGSPSPSPSPSDAGNVVTQKVTALAEESAFRSGLEQPSAPEAPPHSHIQAGAEPGTVPSAVKLLALLGKRVEVLMRDGVQQAVVSLRPTSLGTLEIIVRQLPGGLQISLLASNEEIVRQLQSIVERMRESVEDRHAGSVRILVGYQPRSGQGKEERHRKRDPRENRDGAEVGDARW